MDDPKGIRKYTNDEVGAILRRAFERQPGEGRISHDELLETAREIGVSASDIEEAVAEEARIRETRARIEANRRKAQLLFVVHLIAFVAGNGAIVAVDLMTGDKLWFYWPLIAWTLVLIAHAARLVFFKDADSEQLQAQLDARGQSRARIDAAFRGGPSSRREIPRPPGARRDDDDDFGEDDVKTDIGRYRRG